MHNCLPFMCHVQQKDVGAGARPARFAWKSLCKGISAYWHLSISATSYKQENLKPSTWKVGRGNCPPCWHALIQTHSPHIQYPSEAHPYVHMWLIQPSRTYTCVPLHHVHIWLVLGYTCVGCWWSSESGWCNNAQFYVKPRLWEGALWLRNLTLHHRVDDNLITTVTVDELPHTLHTVISCAASHSDIKCVHVTAITYAQTQCTLSVQYIIKTLMRSILKDLIGWQSHDQLLMNTTFATEYL